MNNSGCVYCHVELSSGLATCRRHAPVVVANPLCDRNSVLDMNYTDGNVTLTVYPEAMCPCGDFEKHGEA